MISGIILASGFSNRMGKDKLLLKIDETYLIEKVIEEVVLSKLGEVILIYRREEVKNIGTKYGLKTIYNDTAHLGQSEAVKLGVKNSNPYTNGYMFFVGDQPFIDVNTINILIDKFLHSPNHIILPIYGGRKGNPVTFPSKLKEELLALEGDSGGRKVIRDNPQLVKDVSFSNSIKGMDIDNVEDLMKLKKLKGGNFDEQY